MALRSLVTIAALSMTLAACGKSGGESSGVKEAGEQCRQSTVKSIDRPFYPGQERSPTFKYHFDHIQHADAAKTTIIYIPGGPGGTSIGKLPQVFPPDFSYVLTDPRGVGCNENADLSIPDDFFRTEYLAADILAIVETLSLKNYMIYGVSYGSMLATVTASAGEQTTLAKPKAVILEGILGRAFESREELYGTYISEWAKLKASLPESVRTKLSSPELPFGFNSEQWAVTISSLMTLGAFRDRGYIPEVYLNFLASDDEAVQQPLRDFAVSATSGVDSAAQRRIYRLLACHEIAAVADDSHELLLTNGNLVPKDGDVCGADGFTADKYDAKKWPITSPIYYFQGDQDPATPVWQAQHHFDSETTAPRSFNLIKKGGHGAFQYGLSDCGGNVMHAIDSEPSTLRAVLDTCALEVETATSN